MIELISEYSQNTHTHTRKYTNKYEKTHIQVPNKVFYCNFYIYVRNDLNEK